ncbi:histidine kinase [Paenibacillus phoenicis]|uniref:Histidine kinase n=1 Tax=Paenibacillus phoenicis TaxID=554117 RepID=A0ABU5PFG1_9BACL|nr:MULTISPECIES: sensor histidine kinase [Paenibacillus]MCT2193687.1 histidine kinase [Paenibacillus sp. p3-SID1389]MEA3568492.1 histidine kinase [Paenibacillus phoenicis]
MRAWLENRVIRFTRGMNLRRKIFIMYGLILLVPSLILGGVTMGIVVRSFHENYVATVDESIKQTAINIDYSKKSYDLLAIRTATDSELIARLGREYADMTQIIDTVDYLDRNFMLTSKYLPGIVDFRIYHTNSTLVEDGRLLWRPQQRLLSGLDERSWYEKTMASSTLLLWSTAPDAPGRIVLTSKILNSAGEPLGMVYILLDYNVVFGNLLKHPFADGGSLYIVDEEKRILATTKQDKIGLRILAEGWLEEGGTDDRKSEGAGKQADGGAAVYDLTGTKQLVTLEPLTSGWYVVALTQMKYMDGRSITLLALIAGTAVLLLALSMFLITTIMNNVVRRIRRLGHRMFDLSRGEFDVTIRNKVQDELGDLELMFNSMSERLGHLVEDIRTTSLQEREQAFKAMQAQINPHFIYNSLSLLRWRALDVQDDEQVRIIDALTTFYRQTLNNQVAVIPIREELEHVKAYLEVQQLRYPGRVRIEWDIDEQAGSLYTLKTLLQPIVENCYAHGAITRQQDAVIRISVKREVGCMVMTVFDNGQGIAPERLAALEAGTYLGSGNGFGTANIRERLALYFGEAAAFKLESEAGAWTRATIRFPACTEPPILRKKGWIGDGFAEGSDRG